jgi:hypothetical protein
MNIFEKFRRLEKIEEKLKDTSDGMLLRIDSDSWSEAEKALFRRVDEISDEYERSGNYELLVQNQDLIYKNIEIMHRRIKELYCYIVPTAIAGYTAIDREIIDYFFQQHFMNFEADFIECVKHLHTWTKHDVDKFLCDLKKTGPCYFRIPRGFNDRNSKEFDENAKSHAKGDDKQEE